MLGKDFIVGQTMITAGADQPLGDVADLLRRHELTRVPVVEGDGSMAGFVTAAAIQVPQRAAAEPVSEEDAARVTGVVSALNLAALVAEGRAG